MKVANAKLIILMICSIENSKKSFAEQRQIYIFFSHLQTYSDSLHFRYFSIETFSISSDLSLYNAYFACIKRLLQLYLFGQEMWSKS